MSLMYELTFIYRMFDREDVRKAKLTHTRQTAERIAGNTKGLKDGTYLYAVSDGEAVKIGITKNIDSRIKSMQTGNYRDIILLKGWFIGDREVARVVEKDVHDSIEHLRLKGEWFKRVGLDLCNIGTTINRSLRITKRRKRKEHIDPQRHTTCGTAVCDWCEGYSSGLKRGYEKHFSSEWKPLPPDSNGEDHNDCNSTKCLWRDGFGHGEMTGRHAVYITEARSVLNEEEFSEVIKELNYRVGLHNARDDRYYKQRDKGVVCGCQACRIVKVVAEIL